MKILHVCALGFLLPLLSFAQQHPAPSNNAASINGIWLGTLHAGPQTLRIQLHLQGPSCALDSIDQKAFGIPCNNVTVNGSSVSFDVPAVSGKWSGQLSTDGKTLTGTWTQGGSLPLVLERQSTAVEAPKNAAPTFDPAMPPVKPEDLQAVLVR